MIPMWVSAILLVTSCPVISENTSREISPVHLETRPEVWSVFDNGLEVALLPIVSMLPPSQQRVTVITFWDAGAQHDPQESSGLTKLAAHLIPLAKAGKRSSRSYRQWQDFHEGLAEIRSGSLHTWIIESVPPDQLSSTIDEIRNRFKNSEVTNNDLDRIRKHLRAEKRSGKYGDSDRLTNKLLDRLDPLRSGPRESDAWNQTSLEEIRKFLEVSFQPTNVRIAIVGPYDPRPIKIAITQTLATIPGGKKLVRPPAISPAHGTVKPIASTDSKSGWVMQGWRVPMPGTIESLALGLFVPRASRSLQAGHGDCHWDPFLNPEVVFIRQEVFGSQPGQPKSIQEALTRIESAFEFAISGKLLGGDYEWARKSIGIHLGAYRVHEEVSMVNPLPVAEAVLLRRVFQMNEIELQNNFGREDGQQLLRLQEKYLTREKTAFGSVIPKSIIDNENPIRRDSR